MKRAAQPGPRRRVLILPEWYPSASDPSSGGFVRDQALAAARRHDVTVLVHDPQGTLSTGRVDLPRRRGGCAPCASIRSTGSGTASGRIRFLLAAARLLRSWRRRGEAPDIVHAHVFSAGFLALLLSRGRYPVVLSEHHTDFIEGKVLGRDALIARFAFRHADLVCPVSARLMRCLEELEPSGRYEVVPNVVDVEAFVANERPPRRAGTTRLLTVAMLSPQKGIEHLLDALAEVRLTRTDFTLDLVGEGPSRGKLERLARERLPPGVVTFHGTRSRAEVAAIMARSDVFVLPSIAETFGVVVIEALAAGLPIIATRAVPEYERLEGRFGIIVAPHDTEALRDAVLRMLEEGWTVPRGDAVELARSFSAPVMSRRWDEVYGAVARAS